jgi:hypothetical protein
VLSSAKVFVFKHLYFILKPGTCVTSSLRNSFISCLHKNLFYCLVALFNDDCSLLICYNNVILSLLIDLNDNLKLTSEEYSHERLLRKILLTSLSIR